VKNNYALKSTGEDEELSTSTFPEVPHDSIKNNDRFQDQISKNLKPTML